MTESKRIKELEQQNAKLTSRGFVGVQEQTIAELQSRIEELEAGLRQLVGKKYATSGYFRRKIKSLLEQAALGGK